MTASPTPPRSEVPSAPAPGPGRRRGASTPGALVGALRSGQLADGLAMAGAAGGAALVGMISWMVAARSLTPAELGVATAFVSAFLLIAGCTEFNLGVGLLRWLPRAGSASALLLRRTTIAIATAAAVASGLYLLLPDASIIVDAVAAPGGETPRWVGAAVFVLAAVLYSMFQIQDFVLVGLGRGWLAPARTLVFALGRLGILLLAGSALTTGGVVLSWVVPTAACVLLVAVQAAWLLSRRTEETPYLPPRGEVLGFLGPTYVGKLAIAVLFNQVPLLMTFRHGPEIGAAFFLVWQAITVVDVVATYFVASLAAAVAHEPERAAELSRRTRRRLMALLVPALGVGVVLAGPALSLFGPEYTGETLALQIMLGGLVLRLLVVHRLGEHQAMGRGFRFARLSLANTALMVGVTALAPTGPGGPVLTVAVGFVAVQAVCAAAVWRPDPRRWARRGPSRGHPAAPPAETDEEPSR